MSPLFVVTHLILAAPTDPLILQQKQQQEPLQTEESIHHCTKRLPEWLECLECLVPIS